MRTKPQQLRAVATAKAVDYFINPIAYQKLGRSDRLTTDRPQGLLNKDGRGIVPPPLDKLVRQNANMNYVSHEQAVKVLNKQKLHNSDKTAFYAVPAISDQNTRSLLLSGIVLKKLNLKQIVILLRMQQLNILPYGMNALQYNMKTSVGHVNLTKLEAHQEKQFAVSNALKITTKGFTVDEKTGLKNYADGDRLIMKIVHELRKYGGIINYHKLSSECRPHRNSVIERTSQGYQTWPVINSTCIQCQYCGMINTVTDKMAPTKVVGNYTKGLIPTVVSAHDVKKDYHTELIQKQTAALDPKKDVVGWYRCGMCFGRLDDIFESYKRVEIVDFKAIMIEEWYVAGLLKQLMKMKYGDIYFDLTEDVKQNLIRHDLQVVTNYYRANTQYVCTVGQELTENEMQQLSETFGNVLIRHDIKMNSDCPYTLAELQCGMLYMLRNSRNGKNGVFSHFITQLLDNRDCHYNYYDDHICPIVTTKNCTNDVVCEHDVSNLEHFFGPMIAQLAINEAMEQLSQFNGCQIILFRQNQTNECNSVNIDGVTTMFLGSSQYGIKLNTNTMNKLSGSDVITFQNENYCLITTLTTNQFVIRKLVKGTYNIREIKRDIMYSENNVIQMPNIDLQDPLTMLLSNVTKSKQIVFDRKLFQALHAYNITGNVKYETIMVYAIAYSRRQFVKPQRVVNYNVVDQEQISAHVILAMLSGQIQKNKFDNDLRLANFFNPTTAFGSLSESVLLYAQKLILNSINEIMTNNFALDIQMWAQLFKEQGTKLMKDATWVPRWRPLLIDLYNCALDNLVVSSSNIETKYKDGKICKHHSSCKPHTGYRRCHCCNLPCVDRFCNCCDEKLDLQIYVKSQRQIDLALLLIKITHLPHGLAGVLSKELIHRQDNYFKGDKNLQSKVQQKSILKTKAKQLISQHVEKQTPTSTSMAKEVQPSRLKVKPQYNNQQRTILTNVLEDVRTVRTNELRQLQDKNNQLKFKTSNKINVMPTMDVIKSIKDIPTSQEAQKLIEDYIPETIVMNKPVSIRLKRVQHALQQGVDNLRSDPQRFMDVTVLPDDFVSMLINQEQYFDVKNTIDYGADLYLPYIPLGKHQFDASCIKIKQFFDTDNTDINTCGYDAYVTATNNLISLEEFRQITRKHDTFSYQDIIKVAELHKLNIVVLFFKQAYVIKNVASPLYHTIAHSSACNGRYTYEHWVAIKAQVCSLPRQYFTCDENSILQSREDVCGLLGYLGKNNEIQCDMIDSWTNLIAEEAFVQSNLTEQQQFMEIGQLSTRNNIVTNNNSQQHMLVKGLIYQRCRDDVIQLFDVLNLPANELINHPQVQQSVNVTLDMFNDVQALYTQKCKSAFIHIANVLMQKHQFNQQQWNEHKCTFVKTQNLNQYLVMIKDSKLKSLDVISIWHDGRPLQLQLYKTNKGQLCINCVQDIQQVRTILIHKRISVGSEIRQLLAYGSSIPPNAQVIRYLQTATLTIGPPGCGKTHTIAKSVQLKDLVVCKTRCALTELQRRCPKNTAIHTFESLSNFKPININDIYVDECTMFEYIEFAKLCELKPKQIKLFGDHSQIGVVDFGRETGVRHIKAIADMVSQQNVTELNTTYRFGQNIVDNIKFLLPNLKTNKASKGEFVYLHKDDVSIDIIKQVVKQYKITKTLVMYNDLKQQLQYNNIDDVETVHKYQGRQSESVLVILKTIGKDEIKLHDSRYLVSACTRAIDRLVVLAEDANETCKRFQDWAVLGRQPNKSEVEVNQNIDESNINMKFKNLKFKDVWQLNQMQLDQLLELVKHVQILGFKLEKFNPTIRKIDDQQVDLQYTDLFVGRSTIHIKPDGYQFNNVAGLVQNHMHKFMNEQILNKNVKTLRDLYGSITLNQVNKLKLNELQFLIQNHEQLSNFDTHCSRLGEITTIYINFNGQIVQVEVNVNGEIKHNGNKTFNAVVDSMKNDNLLDETGLKIDDGTKLQLSNVQISKIQNWAYLSECTMGDCLGLRLLINDDVYIFRKTKNCPWMAGITLRKENRDLTTVDLVRINACQTYFSNTRSIVVSQQATTNQVAFDWLQSLDIFEFNDQFKVFPQAENIFNKIEYVRNANTIFMMERIISAPEFIFNTMVLKQAWCAKQQDYNNERSKKFAMRLMFKPKVLNSSGIIPHQLMLQSTKKRWNFMQLFGQGSAYMPTIHLENEINKQIQMDLQQQECTLLINRTLQDIKKVNNLIVRFLIDQVSINGRFDGLLMSEDDHKSKKTRVGNYIMEQDVKLKQLIQPKIYDLIHVSNRTYENVRATVKLNLPGAQFMQHNDQVAINELKEFMNAMMLQQYAVQMQGLNVIWMNQYPQQALLSELYHCYIVKPSVNNLQQQYESNKQQCVQMLRLYVQNTTYANIKHEQINETTQGVQQLIDNDSTQQSINDKVKLKLSQQICVDAIPIESFRIMLGCDMIYYKTDQLVELLNQSTEKQLFGIIPSDMQTTMHYEFVGNFIAFKNEQYAFWYNQDLMINIQQGRAIQFNNNYYTLTRLHTFQNMACVVLRKCEQYPLICIRSLSSHCGEISAKVPTLNTDLLSILSEQTLIKYEVISAPANIYKHLLARWQMPDTTEMDLLSYGRVLLSGMTITHETVDMTNNVSVQQMLNAIKLVIYTDRRIRAQYQNLCNLVQFMSANVGASEQLLSLLEQFGNILNKTVSGIIDGVTNENLQKLLHIVTQLNIQKLKIVLEDIGTDLLQPTIKYIQYQMVHKIDNLLKQDNELVNDNSDGNNGDQSDVDYKSDNEDLHQFVAEQEKAWQEYETQVQQHKTLNQSKQSKQQNDKMQNTQLLNDVQANTGKINDEMYTEQIDTTSNIKGNRDNVTLKSDDNIIKTITIELTHESGISDVSSDDSTVKEDDFYQDTVQVNGQTRKITANMTIHDPLGLLTDNTNFDVCVCITGSNGDYLPMTKILDLMPQYKLYLFIINSDKIDDFKRYNGAIIGGQMTTQESLNDVVDLMNQTKSETVIGQEILSYQQLSWEGVFMFKVRAKLVIAPSWFLMAPAISQHLQAQLMFVQVIPRKPIIDNKGINLATGRLGPNVEQIYLPMLQTTYKLLHSKLQLQHGINVQKFQFDKVKTLVCTDRKILGDLVNNKYEGDIYLPSIDITSKQISDVTHIDQFMQQKTISTKFCLVNTGSIKNENQVTMIKQCMSVLSQHNFKFVIVDQLINDGLTKWQVTLNRKQITIDKDTQSNVILISKGFNFREHAQRFDCFLGHCGFGTFSTMIYCGVPQLAIVTFGDQYIWRHIVNRDKLGVGICITDNAITSTMQFISNLAIYKAKLQRYSAHVRPDCDTSQCVQYIMRQISNDKTNKLTVDEGLLISSLPRLAFQRRPEIAQLMLITIKQCQLDCAVIMDPQNNKLCVETCVKYYLNTDDLETADQLNQVFSRYNGVAIDIIQISEIVFMLGLNLILYDAINEVMHVQLRFKNVPTLTLMVQQSEIGRHCVVLDDQLINRLNSNRATIEEIDYSVSMQERQSFIDDLSQCVQKTTSQINQAIVNLLSGEQSNDVIKLSILKNKLQFSNLQHVLNRKASYGQPGNQTYQSTVANVEYAPGINNKIILILTNRGWRLGVGICYQQKSQIMTFEQNVMITDCYINLSIDMFSINKTTKMILDGTQKYYCLNQQTLKIVQQKYKDIKTDGIVKPRDLNYDLLVYDFDNRGHDLYNELDIIKNARRVIWLGVNKPHMLNDFKSSHNKPINRLMYKNGQMRFGMEFTHAYIARVISCILLQKGYKTYNVGTLVVSNEQLPVDKNSLEFINVNFTVDKHLYKLNDQIIAKVYNYTKEQLIKEINQNQQITNEILFSIFETEDIPQEFQIEKFQHDIKLQPSYVNTLSVHNITPTIERGVIYFVKNCLYGRLHIQGQGQVNEMVNKIKQLNIDAVGKTLFTQKQVQTTIVPSQVNVQAFISSIPIDQRSSEVLNFANVIINQIDDDIIELEPLVTTTEVNCWSGINNMPTKQAIDLWGNTDLFYMTDVWMPTNKVVIKTTEQIKQYKMIVKETLSQYPERARIMINQQAYQELNVYNRRIQSTFTYRKNKVEQHQLMNKFINTYFVSNNQNFLQQYDQERLSINYQLTTDWIQQRPDVKEKLKQMNQYMQRDHTLEEMSQIKFFVKTESVLKTIPVDSWYGQVARPIMAQSFPITAIFSPVFLELKCRLKKILDQRFIYSDGLTPQQLHNKLLKFGNVKYLFENDLEKQDMQTDDNIIKMEYMIYDILGLDQRVAQLYQQSHAKWRVRGQYLVSRGNSKRLTGQCTTALGNALTNLLCHTQFVHDNNDKIVFVLFLGDDLLIGLNDKPDTKMLNQYIKDNFNINCKPSLNERYGTFCQMLVTLNEGVPHIGPDYVRLRYRYEVTNGCHENDDNSLALRTLSYGMMLGNIDNVQQIINKIVNDLIVPNWYDKTINVKGLMIKYEMTDLQVYDVLNQLLIMMDKRQLFKVQIKLFSSSAAKAG